MGAFLNSLHVPTGDRARVIEALRAMDTEKPPRRELVVLNDQQWTSIFPDMLDSTSYSALSTALSVPVLHIMVAEDACSARMTRTRLATSPQQGHEQRRATPHAQGGTLHG